MNRGIAETTGLPLSANESTPSGVHRAVRHTAVSNIRNLLIMRKATQDKGEVAPAKKLMPVRVKRNNHDVNWKMRYQDKLKRSKQEH
jgi:hypothetical protein